MPSYPIFAPALAMCLLTLAVWVFMAIRRVGYLLRNGIDSQEVATRKQTDDLLPDAINNPSNNLRNLFELPVIFYVVCGYLALMHATDAGYLWAAWIFVAFRMLHSAIHCTINIVNLRFTAYAISSIALWYMVIRLATAIF